MSGERKPLRVLVVEDEPELGRLEVQILGELGGMEAVLGSNGAEGLELAWSWRPDVILLDLVMPVMSGAEMLRQYRQQGGAAKVLVMTGAEPEQAKRIVFPLGADYMLSKPVHWGEVLNLVRTMAGGLEEQCRTLLKELGGNDRSKGFRQAAQCAARLGERGCTLLKEAYVEVARRDRSKMGSVAKNVERLAKEVHRADRPLYRRLTGRRPGDPHLTNREFLSLLSQAARIPL